MNISKESFLTVAARLRAQAETDKASATAFDDSELWLACIQLLSEAVGDSERQWIDRWIYDSEFGSYPDEVLPARNDAEFWDFLCRNLE